MTGRVMAVTLARQRARERTSVTAMATNHPACSKVPGAANTPKK